MVEKPRRRWFRYSLRSLFVVVTLLCCWLAWESSVVRQRRTVLVELRTKPAFRVTTVKEYLRRFPGNVTPPNFTEVSLLRSWLGDEAIAELWYSRYMPDYSDAELSRLKKVFPEAKALEELPQDPCHPGCFPRGTLVDTPGGRLVIESIKAGDAVTSISPGGASATATVQFVFVTDNRIWRVATDAGELFTTETQPLCLSGGNTLPAGKLQSGDTILRWQGEKAGFVQVQCAAPTDRTEKVFNLVLGDSEIFVAGGFLARSKPPTAVSAR